MSNAKYDAPYLLIDGEKVPAGTRITQPIVNPATGETLAALPHASPADLDRALEAAARAFLVWRKVSPYERSKLLRKAAALIRERADHIGMLLTQEQGKPLAEAKIEAMAAADIIEWDAEEGRRSYGRLIPARAEGARYIVMKEPVGPVAAFSPWNFPVVLSTRKISAALATGCSIVIKPAEETPASPLAIAQAFVDAGLPKGVINVVYGVPADVSTHLIQSDVIRKISFTGSVQVGKLLAKQAASGLKRATMELGGHAPVVVFDDADIDQAVPMSVGAKYRNAGQICVAPTRFYVHSSVHDKFVEKFAAMANAIPVGNGMDSASKMGPVANPRRIDAMERFIGDAVKQGAKLMAGGERLGNQGNFWKPTVLADVPPSAKIMNEEPFGPVAVTSRFDTFDEVVKEANRLPFGLASYAFTRSAKTANAIAEAFESGMVSLNGFALAMPETPFGGVKESGYGSEGGTEGLEAYQITKFVSHQT